MPRTQTHRKLSKFWKICENIWSLSSVCQGQTFLWTAYW